MDPALAIGLVVVVAAFLGWWLWAARRRRRRDPDGTEPRDAWDALNRGIDPSESDPAGPGADEPDGAEGPR